ncbi:MAG: DUF4338 domain-containing protein [Deltaproteobacteria bacterium]|nr:DUF4338 domain-containing protein [Deltaproteobacteria bacterium]
MSSGVKNRNKNLLRILRCVEVRPINRSERALWESLLRKYHYLGLRSLVGESLRYMAVYQGHWPGLSGWSAAALKCKVRDQWIGWPPLLQWQRLRLLANNTRFLILPRINIPNLAYRILAVNLKRLSRGWQVLYGHSTWLVESFVDPRFFKGTCYKAAGRVFLSHTREFAKCHSYNQTQQRGQTHETI